MERGSQGMKGRILRDGMNAPIIFKTTNWFLYNSWLSQRYEDKAIPYKISLFFHWPTFEAENVFLFSRIIGRVLALNEIQPQGKEVRRGDESFAGGLPTTHHELTAGWVGASLSSRKVYNFSVNRFQSQGPLLQTLCPQHFITVSPSLLFFYLSFFKSFFLLYSSSLSVYFS